MEEDDFELINICNEVCADILSEFENDEECNSDDTDLAESSRKRNVLPIISESESSDSEDTILENEQNCSTSNWSQIDNNITVNPFLGNSGVKVFPRNAENISDVVDLFNSLRLMSKFVFLHGKGTNLPHNPNLEGQGVSFCLAPTNQPVRLGWPFQ
ncbi:hypothetical protein WA026_015165 [Henosepilachna vigintioctopunctata]|uniref:Uncharacterized protein n=1 Tax=Henosepilachna vigintioctopunctata TaxID=420089 RepID=A0AAW1TTA9_9CUCU